MYPLSFSKPDAELNLDTVALWIHDKDWCRMRSQKALLLPRNCSDSAAEDGDKYLRFERLYIHNT